MSFEKKYYETAYMWENGVLQDEKNIHRIKTTAELIPKDVTTLVDVGCGNGVFLNYLLENRKELNLTGIDRSEFALQYVKANKKIGDISALPFENNLFDCVTCLQVIEHLPVPVYEIALTELCRISKKYVIIGVPYNEVLEDSYTKCPSCASIFNWELHLRSYTKTSMQNLLQQNGFKCVSHQTFGADVKYVGHDLYRKIFYPAQFLKWHSPICPVCGYEDGNEVKTTIAASAVVKKPVKRSIISYLSPLPKLIWPKTSKDYWILALYEKQ